MTTTGITHLFLFLLSIPRDRAVCAACPDGNLVGTFLFAAAIRSELFAEGIADAEVLFAGELNFSLFAVFGTEDARIPGIMSRLHARLVSFGTLCGWRLNGGQTTQVLPEYFVPFRIAQEALAINKIRVEALRAYSDLPPQ